MGIAKFSIQNSMACLPDLFTYVPCTSDVIYHVPEYTMYRGGDSYPKVGGRNFATSTSHIISPGLPLLFLEYIMQKGKKNEERNLNVWDRSFEKLDIPHA